MFDTKSLTGVRVSTAFPGESAPQFGIVIGSGGPWQVKVKWEDDSTGIYHIEDVIFE